MKDRGTEVNRKDKRLKILATDEIESIYARPKFTREFVFSNQHLSVDQFRDFV
jgi:hypothetical protein